MKKNNNIWGKINIHFSIINNILKLYYLSTFKILIIYNYIGKYIGKLYENIWKNNLLSLINIVQSNYNVKCMKIFAFLFKKHCKKFILKGNILNVIFL